MCHAQNVHFIPDVLYTYYVNDLQKEWQKYPNDYYKAVIGLYESRKKTILTWNSYDSITHECVDREYLCKAIKSLELTFSPKMQLSKDERINRIKYIISCTELESFKVPSMLGVYQKCIMRLIKFHSWNTLYFIFNIKVFVESFK